MTRGRCEIRRQPGRGGCSPDWPKRPRDVYFGFLDRVKTFGMKALFLFNFTLEDHVWRPCGGRVGEGGGVVEPGDGLAFGMTLCPGNDLGILAVVNRSEFRFATVSGSQRNGEGIFVGWVSGRSSC